jgi:hypothetical protein
MKKVILVGLMMMFAGGAIASETAFVLQPIIHSAQFVDPCPDSPDAPTPANGFCAEGSICPVGYDPVAKYCWGGGLHRCGTTCRDNQMYGR